MRTERSGFSWVHADDTELICDVCRPVYGLIFLFKWEQNLETDKPATEGDAPVYFAQQIINNACATQAMLSILLNQPDTELEIGEQLKQFRVCRCHLLCAPVLAKALLHEEVSWEGRSLH